MSELIKRLKEERIQGSSVVLNYSNFDYWVNWDDIVNIVEDHDQPQLNENQQQVLDWLKDYYKENRPFTTAFGAIMNIASKRWMFIKQNLKENQQDQVLQTFIKWVLEQDERRN